MSSLTDRYLAATLRAVPAERRAELGDELRASIDDMVEGRSAAGTDRATAEREVLTELGDPDQLAARYAGRRLQLIGPAYYLVWRRLLRLLLSFVPATVGVVVTMVELAVGDAPGGAVGEGVVAALNTTVQIGFWVTLVFAILERTNTTVELSPWTVDQLPDTPVDRDISLVDTAVSVAMILLFAALLPWQHYRSWIEDDSGANIPVLDPALWTSWLPVLMAVLVASAAFEVVKYRIGRWTWGLVVVKGVIDLAFTAPLVWLLLTDRLLNPALVERFDWLRSGGADTVARIAVAVTVVVVVWSLIDSAVRTYRRTR